MKPFLLIILILVVHSFNLAQTIPDANILNDEGGAVLIIGTVSYTNAFFSAGVAEPLIVLEEQSGFYQHNFDYSLPESAQTLGQITSDFTQSPFTYQLLLPAEPQAPLLDIDGDEQGDVMVFQLAYWSNVFGNAYLEQRDLFGRAWSGSYSSARVSSSALNRDEYIGGNILVYAPQASPFPADFGADERLFTTDDPLVVLPQGYTLVDMDSSPFKFDRSRYPTVDLLESSSVTADDFSSLSYSAAFDAMLEKFRHEYAFTAHKNIDWDALATEFRPRFEAAEQAQDSNAYEWALQEFVWSIPDGHLQMTFSPSLIDAFFAATDGGIGIAVRELSDSRMIVSYLAENSLAARAGIQLEAEITAINGIAAQTALEQTRAWSAPFSTEHVRRLQQLRYITRFPIGESVEIRYINPDSTTEAIASMTAEFETESFDASSFNVSRTGFELPVQYRLIDDFLYVEITSFLDDARLTIDLWERMLSELKLTTVQGVIIDMRNNEGGRAFLAHQMAAYFFEEALELGNSARYDAALEDFAFNPVPARFILPPPDLRYAGKIAVLVGANCASSCEFFAYDLSLQNRAVIVGQYPSAGLGGSVEQFFMPNGMTVQMTVGRAVDANGEIHIEGRGVVPDILVPVTAESVLSGDDVVLQAAMEALRQP